MTGIKLGLSKFFVITLLILTLTTFTSAYTDSSFLAWYKSDVALSYPNYFGIYNGTITNAVYTASGKINGAYSYDGTGDRIGVGQSDQMITNATGWTVGGWYYFADNNADRALLSCYASAGFDNTFPVHFYYTGSGTDELYASAKEGSTEYISRYAWTPAINTWYFIAARYSTITNRITLRVNSTNVNTTLLGNGTYTDTGTCTYGSIFASGSWVFDFNGRQDEQFWLQYAASDAELDSLYNSGSGTTPPFGTANTSVTYNSPVNHSVKWVANSPQLQLNVTINAFGSVLTALYAYLYNSTGLVNTYYSQVASNNHTINITSLPIGAYYINTTAVNFTNVTIPDTSGNQNNLTSVRQVVINSTCGKDGTLGACFTNITNEYLQGEAGSTYIQNVTGQTFNISLDFNWRGSSTDTQTILRLYRVVNQGTTGLTLSVDESASSFNVAIANSTGSLLTTCIMNIEQNAWYSVRIAYNTTTLLCYNNSVLYFSRNTTWSGLSTGRMTLGAQPSTTPAVNTFNGSVDNVLIENGTGITLNATFDSAYFLNSVLGGVLNFTVYNLTNGSITSPSNNSAQASQFLNVSWTNTTFTPSGIALSIANFSLLLFNSDGSFNRSLANTTNLSTVVDWYNQNLSTGVYRLRVVAWDNQTNSVNYTDQYINLTTNALLNITATSANTNLTITTFNATIVGGNINTTLGTTTGLIQIDIIKNETYNITIYYANLTTNSTIYSTNQSHNQINFSLYTLNTLIVYFYDENTMQLMNITTYLDIFSDTYTTNYTANNGTLVTTLLTPETYLARYYATGYSERFYQFTITNDTTTTLTLYLNNDTDSILVTVKDNALQVVEGAIVKAQKKLVTTGEFITIEIGRTDFNGELLMSLTLNDDFYRFIVTVDGETRLTTEEAYIIDTSVLLILPSEGGTGEDIFTYQDIVNSLSFSTSLNRFLFTFNDPSNVDRTYCLKVKNQTGWVNQSCITDTAGSLTAYVTPTNGTTYTAYSSVYFDVEQPLQTLSHHFEGTTGPDETGDNNNNGRLAAFIQFGIIIILIFISLKTMPELIPLSVALGLILGRSMNLTSFSWTTITAVSFALLVITGWLAKKRPVN